MKQSRMLLIALAPFACWGATAEEEALQQQLDLLRQQLIQQNQALHQLQARLEAVKAAGATTATAGVGAGAAVASTQQDASRRTPEVGRSTEDLMIEQHNVFDRALTVDVGLSYQHYNRKDLALRGFLALDAIFLGEINLDRVRSDQWTADVITRYTLNDRWQLELALPYMFRNTNYQSTGKENSSRDFEEQSVSDGGLGDLSLAIYYRVMAESEDWPDLVWNFRAKAPTGKDPYGIEINTSESGNLVTPKELATGNGLWQLSTGFSLVKTMDPAILFASLNYGHSLKQDFDDISYQPGNQPGSIQLGDWYEYGLGRIRSQRTLQPLLQHQPARHHGVRAGVRRLCHGEGHRLRCQRRQLWHGVDLGHHRQPLHGGQLVCRAHHGCTGLHHRDPLPLPLLALSGPGQVDDKKRGRHNASLFLLPPACLAGHR